LSFIIQMSLSRPLALNGIKVVGEGRDYCPFLSLPNEVITRVLSDLPSKDRLRARVNKRLDAIEAKTDLKEVTVVEGVENSNATHPIDSNEIRFAINNSHSIDCISKIAKYDSIGSLTITFAGLGRIGMHIHSLIKQFKNLKILTLRFKQRTIERFLMNSSFVLDLTGLCEELTLELTADLAGDWGRILHKMAVNMINGLIKCRKFEFNQVKGIHFQWFLKRIGIEFSSGR
ncbi:hypothetical protein PMAYCL1PPCAC_01656, partial [Pristionchus mayeri]